MLRKPIALVNTQRIPLGGAERISIDYISEAVTLRVVDGDDIMLREYFNSDDPDVMAEITVSGVTGEAIDIRHGARSVLFSFLRGYVEVDLPRAFFGALRIKTVSGRVDAEGRLALEDLKISSTSGRLRVDAARAGTAALHTVSGSIHAGNLEAMVDIQSTSGSIRVDTAAGAGSYRSVSGSLYAAYTALVGDLTLTSTSGSIRLGVADNLAFTVDATSVSGRVDMPIHGDVTGGRNDLHGTVGKGGIAHIKAKTVSGRIEITRA